MMYESKLAVAIKSAGKVLREFKDTVAIPFGSEYSIFVRNLNTVRAQLKITVDGQDATDGLAIVVDPNSTLELERFVTNGNLAGGNRFKFIERTSKIEQHRGVKAEDGLIRVEFQFEAVPVPCPVYYPPLVVSPTVWYYAPPVYRTNGPLRGMSFNNGGFGPGASGTVSTTSAYTSDVQCDAVGALDVERSAMANMVYDSHAVNDAGITVPGSVSDQKFQTVASFPLEIQQHAIVLKLVGETVTGKKVIQAVTVKTKQVCPTCGHKNKANVKFCSECGTGLQIV